MQLPPVQTASDGGFGDPAYIRTVSIISLHPFLPVAVSNLPVYLGCNFLYLKALIPSILIPDSAE